MGVGGMADRAAPRICVDPFGDSAVMVTASADTGAGRRGAVAALRDQILRRRPHGVTDVVSGLESLLVEFDPLVTTPEHLDHELGILAELTAVAGDARPSGHELVIPFVAGGEGGPDLAAVAGELAMTEDEVVDAVTSSTLTIALLAAAMAPMMTGVRLPAPVARRRTPRTDVPPGSVMVAGDSAIVQPFPGPSGWRVIGRTPLTVVDIRHRPPVSFAPGDTVRFRRITGEEAAELAGRFLVTAEDGRP